MDQNGQMDTRLNAAMGGSFAIGGDLTVNRLGYGTMRLVGEGAWGEPDDAANARRVLRHNCGRWISTRPAKRSTSPIRRRSRNWRRSSATR